MKNTLTADTGCFHHMALEFDDHPFWNYSLRVYGGDGVAAACIALQDRLGIDVNVLLYCSWIGHSGRGVMTAAELDAALAAVSEWQGTIVRRLRAVRNALGGGGGGLAPALGEISTALRGEILKIEVDSEHVEQLMLAGAVHRPVTDGAPEDRRAADAAANISAYFSVQGAICERADADNLAVVLGAAFTAVDKTRLAEWVDAIRRKPERP